MVPLPNVLKVDLRIEVNDQPLVISAQVQGEGEHARRAAAELSAAVAAVLAAVPKSTPSLISSEATGPILTTAVADAAPDSAAPDATVLRADRAGEADGSPTDATPSATAPSLVVQMQRHRAKINLGFGGLLLALAVLVPAIVPADQRREVLIVTLLFGLTSALLLFTAALPSLGQPAMAAGHAQASPTRMRVAGQKANISRLRLSAKRRTSMKAGWGIVLGAAFVMLGLLAPFTLGATTADERFIIMLGFAPISVVGFFLIAIFGRGLFIRLLSQYEATQSRPAAAPVSMPVAKRPLVTRVPQTLEYRAIVPAAIVGLLILMIVVVGLVIYATVASAVR